MVQAEPVLLDLWNIFDAVQPGLLGSAREFNRDYESDLADRMQAATRLKQRLLYEQPHAFILRRTKADVLDRPQKYEHIVPSVMSSEEVDAHRKLSVGMRASVKSKAS